MRRLTARPGLFLALALALASTGCGLFDLDPDERDELRENLRKWAGQGIADYTYVFQRTGCECLPEHTRPYVIRVAGDGVAEVTDEQTGEPAPEAFNPYTVMGLFGLAGDALDRAIEATVEYDPVYGYPTLISADYSREIADDEFVVRARDLLPLRQ